MLSRQEHLQVRTSDFTPNSLRLINNSNKTTIHNNTQNTTLNSGSVVLKKDLVVGN